MENQPGPIHGRGTDNNPANRFEKISYLPDLDMIDPDDPAPTTQFFRDTTRTILATNDSPDVGFDVSINPYRGCEHGCIYCYARPTHEYLGFSSGLDFETKIMVKEDAPELLRRELNSPRWEPKMVALSGVTDCYQPIERRLQITRRCLEVFAEFRNPVGIVTKNHLVTRDIDILSELAQHQAAVVYLSITTLDAGLAGKLEPRASRPQGRLKAIEELTAAGIPVGVLIAPVIPGLTDHEMPAIMEAAVQAGAKYSGFVMLRLPHAVSELFERWLEQHVPLQKEKVLGRVRAMRDGKLNETKFGSRMVGKGALAEQFEQLFELARRKTGIEGNRVRLSTAAFRRPGGTQRMLFE